jgi:hypothetical protein
MAIEDTHLGWFICVTHSFALSSSSFEFTLVNLMLEDLSAMEMLEPEPKLSYILGSIGNQHSIPVQ